MEINKMFILKTVACLRAKRLHTEENCKQVFLEKELTEIIKLYTAQASTLLV